MDPGSKAPVLDCPWNQEISLTRKTDQEEMIGNKVEINIAAAIGKISRRHYSKIQSYEKRNVY